MAAMTLYEELENVLTNRMRNALRTGERINAPAGYPILLKSSPCLYAWPRRATFPAYANSRTKSSIAPLKSGWLRSGPKATIRTLVREFHQALSPRLSGLLPVRPKFQFRLAPSAPNHGR
jgi:hypothetical protein